MPAAGTFRPGPSKGKATSYSDFFKGTTRPATSQGSSPQKDNSDTGSSVPVRKSPATSSAGGYSAYPPETYSPKGVKPAVNPKAEALKRRLKRRTLGKANAKLKTKR